MRLGRVATLFADTELRKNSSQQVVRRKFAGNLPEGNLSFPQFLRQELAGPGGFEGVAPRVEMRSRALDGVQVAPARRVGPFTDVADAGLAFQVFTQRVDARTS